MTESTAVAVVERPPASTQAVSVWHSPASFEQAQRMANALVKSNMVPESYRDNIGNALIALDISQRTNSSPLMVMQNLHIIEGRPSWSSQFVIAALNSCGRFTPLRFRVTDLGNQEVSKDEWSGPKGDRTKRTVKFQVKNLTCVATSTDRATGEVLEGPTVSIAMAVAEGWYSKPGSKWVTMPELMLRYRAAKFFGNLYAPDILMGMSTDDERRDLDDVEYVEVKQAPPPPPPVAPEPDKPKRSKGVAAAMAAKPEPAKPVAAAVVPEPIAEAEIITSDSDDPGDYDVDDVQDGDPI